MQPIKTLLNEMEEYARQNRVPIISPAGASLLIEVVKQKQPLFVLEIGTAIGYSSILMATAAPGAGILTIELDDQRIEIARQFIARAGLTERISILCGDAADRLSEVTGPFDFVFIDAAKGQYLDYLHKTLDKLSTGSMIAADNVLFRGLVAGNEVPPKRYRTIVNRLKEYLAFVSADPRFETVVHPDGDGMAISYYKGDGV